MPKQSEIIKELKALSDKDLAKRLEELRLRERELSFRTQGDEIRNVHEFSKTRKDIARVLTITNQRRRISPATQEASEKKVA